MPTPGMSGISARPPTLMKMRGAVSRSSPTLTVVASSKRAWPNSNVTLGRPRSQASLPARPSAEIFCDLACTLAMSTLTGPVTTPKSAPRRARWAA